MTHTLQDRCRCLIAALLLLPSLAAAQGTTGSISGTVTDQNNAVVPGAAVFAKNTETRFVRSAVTNSSGLYRLTGLPSGSYEITIEAEGFKKFAQKGITVDV